MRRTISRLLLPPLAIALLGGASGCDVGSDGEDARGALPVDRLREGGHVLVFRHASTDSGMDTTNDLTDCSRQRPRN